MKMFLNAAAVCLTLAIASEANAQMGTNYFQVTYEWQAGSIPPRWHSQYRITIQNQGPSEIVMIPGYPDVYSDEPRWRFTLSPTETQMASLIKFVEDNDVLGKNWAVKQANGIPPPVRTGGSLCNITITKWAQGGYMRVGPPCDDEKVDAAYKEQKNALIELIKGIVPPNDWAQLQASMKQYSDGAMKK